MKNCKKQEMVLLIILSIMITPTSALAKIDVFKQNVNQTLQGKIKSIAVPAETVINISLDKSLSSKNSKIGEPVVASVKEPVYIGPYLAIPQNSIISGKITDINRVMRKNGPYPYLIVNFNQLTLMNHKTMPINASLIAYKTGLQSKDYLWQIPQKKNKVKERLGSAAEGAVVGFFFNPIFGPVVGAGAGVLKSAAIEKVIQKSPITIKANEEIPIAVQEGFKILVDTRKIPAS